MAAKFKIKLSIDKGADFSKTVVWKVGATAQTVAPMDLTGCTARMQMRSTIESTTVLKEFTTENGGIVLGGTAGTIEYAIMTATVTAAITWTSAVYDLEIILSTGIVVRKIYGAVSVSAEVTRA